MDQRLAVASTAIPAEEAPSAKDMPGPGLSAWLQGLAPSHQSFTRARKDTEARKTAFIFSRARRPVPILTSEIAFCEPESSRNSHKAVLTILA